MTSPPPPERATDPTAARIVEALVHEALLPPQDRTSALRVVSRTLNAAPSTGPPGAEPAPSGAGLRAAVPSGDLLRRRLVEVLAYVGAGLVVSGVLLFVGLRWYLLGLGAQLAVLAVAAVLLAAAGLAVAVGSARAHGGRRADGDVRRRLASVLFTGAALTSASAVGVGVEHVRSAPMAGVSALPYLTFAMLCIVGYVLSPSLVGQLGVWVGTVVAVEDLTDWWMGDWWLSGSESVAYGSALVGIGVVWAGVTEARWWREATVGRLVGCGTAVAGAQQITSNGPSPAFGYGVYLLLAVAGFGLYLFRRAWPYLALGVVALTMSVTQAAFHWYRDSIGAPGMLLVAGVAVLGSSLLALRLWRQAPGSGG
ncbi:hypothetical protein [Intrasporangium sp.]|uniref:hypothetical protein n=1 Tax=Intrasporangium sp. TaxID=1925024 RepID=UPI003221F24C